MGRKIVIVGSGVAGVTAAETARKNNPQAEITLFGREEDLFYFRMRLPDIISETLSPDKILAKPKAWYQEANINLKQGEEVSVIEPDNNIIMTTKGSEYSYDYLLLATGAEANKPLFNGVNYKGVFVVRTLRDALNLNKFVKERNIKNAVLIGGGLLGLETGHALTNLGLEVSVIEKSERILPFNTTPYGAVILQKMLFDLGFKFYLAAEVKQIKSFDEQYVAKVVLNNDTKIETQLVIISAGITPNINVAQNAGLKTNRGIVVDKNLRTEYKNIFAAGDCAQTPACRGGLWLIAREQGHIAGHNISVEKAFDYLSYAPIPPATTLKVAGVDLTSAGFLDAEEAFQNSVETYCQECNDRYRKVIIDDNNHIIGFLNLGSTVGNTQLSAALKNKAVIAKKIQKQLEDIDYNFENFN